MGTPAPRRARVVYVVTAEPVVALHPDADRNQSGGVLAVKNVQGRQVFYLPGTRALCARGEERLNCRYPRSGCQRTRMWCFSSHTATCNQHNEISIDLEQI